MAKSSGPYEIPHVSLNLGKTNASEISNSIRDALGNPNLQPFVIKQDDERIPG